MAYSEAFKAEALIKLALNGNNYNKTSEELGISKSTLSRWQQESPKMEQKTNYEDRYQVSIKDVIEAALVELLENIPTMKGSDWAIAVGILSDKLMLLNGQPTERVENIQYIADLMNRMPQDERDSIIAEAYAILEESSGVSSSY